MSAIKKIGCFLIIVLALGCNKEQIGPQRTIDEPTNSSDARVWVLNEGLFNFGNASISILDEKGNVLEQNAYFNRNEEQLGDVLQSATVAGDLVYLVLNNSGKVVVVDKNLKKVTEYNGFESPRYWLEVSEQVAFVSDLYAGSISVFSKTTNEIIWQIEAGAWTEEMVLWDGFVYAIKKGPQPAILKIDPENYSIISSTPTQTNPRDLVVYDSKLFWLCDGAQGTAGGIFYLEDNNAELLTHTVDTAPNQLMAGQELYLWAGILQRVDMDGQLTNVQTEIPTIDVLYGAKLAPDGQTVWLADAKDYISSGTVFRLEIDSENVDFASVGIIPRDFVWIDW